MGGSINDRHVTSWRAWWVNEWEKITEELRKYNGLDKIQFVSENAPDKMTKRECKE